MFIWFLVISLLIYFVFHLLGSLYELAQRLSFKSEHKLYLDILLKLKKIKLTLESGSLPEMHEWDSFQSSGNSLQSLIYLSINELRKSGCPIIPTLSRFEELVEFQKEMISMAELKSSQAIAQSSICLLIIPILSAFLYFIAPWLEANFLQWIWLSFLSFSVCFIGFLWMLFLCEQSVWGGVCSSQKKCILDAQIFIELVLSKIQSGQSADQAWSNCIEFFKENESEFSFFVLFNDSKSTGKVYDLICSLIKTSRSSIYFNLLEGKPTLDALSFYVKNFRLEYRALVLKKLEKLPMAVLKPLFICVAPSVLLLIVSVVYFSWQEFGGSGF